MCLTSDACGGLSLSMINHFLYCDNVQLLINVGCCYNLLPEGKSQILVSDFRWLSNVTGPSTAEYPLGSNSETACSPSNKSMDPRIPRDYYTETLLSRSTTASFCST